MKRLSVRTRLNLGVTSKPTTASFLAARLDPSTLSIPLLAPEPAAGTQPLQNAAPLSRMDGEQKQEHHPLSDESHLLESLDRLTVQPAASYGEGDPPSRPKINLPVAARASFSTSFNVVCPDDYCAAYPRVQISIDRDEQLGRLVVTVVPSARGYTWSTYRKECSRITTHITLADGTRVKGIGKRIPSFTLTDCEFCEYNPETGELRAVMPDYALLLPPRGSGKGSRYVTHRGKKKTTRPEDLPIQRVHQGERKPPKPADTAEQAPTPAPTPAPAELPEYSYTKIDAKHLQPRPLPSLEELREAANVLKRAKLAHPNDITFRIDITTGMLAVHVTVDLMS